MLLTLHFILSCCYSDQNQFKGLIIHLPKSTVSFCLGESLGEILSCFLNQIYLKNIKLCSVFLYTLCIKLKLLIKMVICILIIIQDIS